MMKKRKLDIIDEIIIHCTASRCSHPVTAADVDKMHRKRGFEMIGYNFVVEIDGNIVPGRPLNCIPAHCKGYNTHSIGIAYVGGYDERGNVADTRNALQKRALVDLITSLLYFYPNITNISGHRDYANKACPCFDAKKEYAQLLSVARRIDGSHSVFDCLALPPSMFKSNGLEQANPARDDNFI